MNFTPHEYQRYCIGRILDTPFIGLYLDMGLGKTVITLTAANELIYNRFAVRRVLIIAPKKVAEATWSTEAAKWEHGTNKFVQSTCGSALFSGARSSG